MKTWTLVTAGAFAGMALAHSAVYASDYQSELSVDYADIDIDGFSDSELGIAGTFHFNSVATQGLPLAEASFLNNASNIQVGYSTSDETEVDTLVALIEHYAENLYLAGFYANSDNDFIDSTDLGLRLGFAPSKRSLIFIGYSESETDTPIGTSESSTLSIGGKHVAPVGSETAFALEGEISMLDDDDNTMFLDVSADYFFNAMFSAGIRFEESDADDFDTGFGFGGRMFFTPLLSVGLEFETQDETDIFTIYGTARF